MVMTAATERSAPEGKKTLGHVALHYKTLEDGPKAARLLDLMGFRRLQQFTIPDGSTFYQFLVNEDRIEDGVGTIYLLKLPEKMAALNEAVREALKVGKPDQHPAVQQLYDYQAQDPESGFHIGLMIDRLDELETIVMRLKDDVELQGRVKLIANRARPGNAQIDAAMAASPVFGDAERHCYGRFGCQVFVQTDLLASGPLGADMVIELDHAFPGQPVNMFNKTETA